MMVFETKPVDFAPRFEVVSCFCELKGKFLLLHRQEVKPQGNKWGVVAGKIDPGETPETAILREILEETGKISEQKKVNFFKKVFVRYADLDFVYYIFDMDFEDGEVKIRTSEHSKYKWVTPTEALKMDLIEDLDKCIGMFYT